jgi:hypothetical protein
MSSSATIMRPCGRRSGAASIMLAAAVVLAGSACYQFHEVELPPPPPPVPPVVISSIVPEGCTRVGEASATGSATDDPSEAAERARDQLRRNAASVGGNYVVLDMQAGGATNVETSTEGMFAGSSSGGAYGHSFGGVISLESDTTADIETSLWGTVFSCPNIDLTPPAEDAPCGVHDDCPAGQFCAPSGRCRRP